jgi:hypothetical protein
MIDILKGRMASTSRAAKVVKFAAILRYPPISSESENQVVTAITGFNMAIILTSSTWRIDGANRAGAG